MQTTSNSCGRYFHGGFDLGVWVFSSRDSGANVSGECAGLRCVQSAVFGRCSWPRKAFFPFQFQFAVSVLQILMSNGGICLWRLLIKKKKTKRKEKNVFTTRLFHFLAFSALTVYVAFSSARINESNSLAGAQGVWVMQVSVLHGNGWCEMGKDSTGCARVGFSGRIDHRAIAMVAGKWWLLAFQPS